MSDFERAYNRIKELTIREGGSDDYLQLKLAEEIGELQQAYNRMKNLKPSFNSEEELKDAFLDECADSLIVLLSILSRNGARPLNILNRIEEGCDNWEEKYFN